MRGLRPSSFRALMAAALAAAALATVPSRAATRVTDAPAGFDHAAEAQRFFALKRAPAGETAVPAHLYALARQKAAGLPLFSSALGQLVTREARELRHQSRHRRGRHERGSDG